MQQNSHSTHSFSQSFPPTQHPLILSLFSAFKPVTTLKDVDISCQTLNTNGAFLKSDNLNRSMRPLGVRLQTVNDHTWRRGETRRGNNMKLEAHDKVSLNCPQRHRAETCAYQINPIPATWFSGWCLEVIMLSAAAILCPLRKLTRARFLQQTAERA